MAEAAVKKTTLRDIGDRWQQFAQLVDEEGDAIPQEVIADQWEALEGEFDQKAVRVWEYTKALDPEIDHLAKEIARLQKRKKARENRRDSLKTYVAMQMERTGRKKVDALNRTLTLVAGRTKLVVDNQDELPPEFVETHVRYEVDKRSLKERLEAIDKMRASGADAETLPGAHLEQGAPHIKES